MNKTTTQNGAVFIELAITMPLLIFLMLAALEFSKAISEYKTLVNQTRSAARYLTSRAPGSASSEGECIVKTSTTACSGPTILPGLDNAVINIQDAISAASSHGAQSTSQNSVHAVSINLISVTISGYQYQSLLGGFNFGIFNIPATITFNPISTTMRQVN